MPLWNGLSNGPYIYKSCYSVLTASIPSLKIESKNWWSSPREIFIARREPGKRMRRTMAMSQLRQRLSYNHLQRKYYPAQTQKTLGAGGRDRRWVGVARQVGSTRVGGVCFAYVDMFGCTTTPCFYCICCCCAYIHGYIVLQKCFVCNCETIVARNQRGDDSRI